MVTIELTTDQILSLWESKTRNFAKDQPERFYCYEVNGMEVNHSFIDIVGDERWEYENSSIFFFSNQLESIIFYNFIVHKTTLSAILCSDEQNDSDESYVVVVNIPFDFSKDGESSGKTIKESIIK